MALNLLAGHTMVTRFFQDINSLAANDAEREYIAIGNGFLALAVSLMEEVSQATLPSLLNHSGLSDIYNYHIRYFPQHCIESESLLNNHWFKQHDDPSHKTEFALALAYTLEHLAWDTLCQHAASDELTIMLLAEHLQLNLIIYRIKGEKIWPACDQSLNDRNGKPAIIMQFSGNNFFMPFLVPRAWYASLSSPLIMSPKRSNEKTTAFIEQARASTQQLLKSYRDNIHRLAAMLEAKELIHDDLSHIYILAEVNGLNPNVYHGTQVYIEHLLQVMAPGEVNQEPLSFDQVLVQAIARALSCGTLHWDTIHLYLDESHMHPQANSNHIPSAKHH